MVTRLGELNRTQQSKLFGNGVAAHPTARCHLRPNLLDDLINAGDFAATKAMMVRATADENGDLLKGRRAVQPREHVREDELSASLELLPEPSLPSRPGMGIEGGFEMKEIVCAGVVSDDVELSLPAAVAEPTDLHIAPDDIVLPLIVLAEQVLEV